MTNNAERIRSEVGRVVTNASNWPTPVGAQMLGRDLSEPIDKIVEAVLSITHESNSKRPSTLRDAIAEELADTLHCSRDWLAWNYGTMTEEDFHTASEDDEYVDGFAQGISKALSENLDLEAFDYALKAFGHPEPGQSVALKNAILEYVKHL